QNPKVLNIDSTFTVSLMPGLTLKQLLPLTDFMLIKKFGVVTEFEVTRNTASHFFDSGKTPDQIFTLINEFSYYDVPQNLKASIIDWYSSYSSAVLYKGYVLKVTETNISLVENNPKVRPFLKEKLADGIYLLNIPDDGDISVFMHESGLELLGSVKTPQVLGEQLPFPVLRAGRNLLPQNESAGEESAGRKDDFEASGNSRLSVNDVVDDGNSSSKLISEFKDFVQLSDFDAHQKESLLNRISRRLIVSKSQLTPSAVRSEILEADGMDFSGKVHLIEAAIKESDLLELTLPDYKGGETYFTLVGTPLGLSRTDDEAVLRLSVRPSDTIENVIVSRITYLRRLRF
nr:helicase-associated domain-containing protein [Treponema sp.]